MKIKQHSVLAALGVLVLGTTMGHAQVAFDWAMVGDINNGADPLNSGSVPGIGSVSYVFNIATKEVNISQYTEFLNAVAKTDITGLYNPDMASNLNIAGITRTGSSGSYIYTAISGSENRPVTYVSWNDAARFVNWLHNGQGSGSTETGVYNMSLATPTRSGSATYWIPSENEWYKAAYYDPGVSGPGDDYWLYPTRSDSAPGNEIGAGANQANYRAGDYATTPGNNTFSSSQNYLTDGGVFTNSASFYGTYDQGGNVWEWNDTVIAGSSRGLRGGSWNFRFDSDLQSSNHGSVGPEVESGGVGFRVAAIPEPSTCALLALGGAALLFITRKKKSAA